MIALHALGFNVIPGKVIDEHPAAASVIQPVHGTLLRVLVSPAVTSCGRENWGGCPLTSVSLGA